MGILDPTGDVHFDSISRYMVITYWLYHKCQPQNTKTISMKVSQTAPQFGPQKNTAALAPPKGCDQRRPLRRNWPCGWPSKLVNLLTHIYHLSLGLSMYLPTYQSTHLPIFLSIYVFIYLSTSLSSIYIFIHLSIYSSIYLFIVYPFIL